MNASTLTRALALPALLALATASAQAADFDRTINAGNSPSVSVATGAGYIHIRPGTGSQVHIIGHVHSSHSDSDVNARISQIVANPPITQSGNEITIGTRHNDGDIYENIVVDYDVTLPATSVIAAATGSGDVDIQNAGSKLNAHSGSGSVRAHGIPGPATLQTGSGSIELEQTAAGEVHAQTGSGTIHLSGVTKSLYAQTGSGSIEVTGKPSPDWTLRTGSGSIRLTVGNVPFTVEANTGSGGIHIQQPVSMQGGMNRHHLTAIVNGGGPSINLSTGSGDIQIQ
jgi:Putative adhesin